MICVANNVSMGGAGTIYYIEILDIGIRHHISFTFHTCTEYSNKTIRAFGVTAADFPEWRLRHALLKLSQPMSGESQPNLFQIIR